MKEKKRRKKVWQYEILLWFIIISNKWLTLFSMNKVRWERNINRDIYV